MLTPSYVPDFDQQIVLVTGGAQGIGLELCRAFAAHGAHVIIADRQAAQADAAAQQLQADGGRAQAWPIDLADPDAIRQMMQTIGQQHGRLDILLHNAAYFPLTPLAEISEAVLSRTLAVNLSALFWLTQAALPWLPKPGGRILATSSVTGPRVAYPGLAHYAASKAGVNGFIRAAALELAPSGITVNGVEPGMIRTPAMANLGDEAINHTIARAIPLGRLGEATDIAAAMLFLASGAANYITGQTIVVDGGATLPESSAISL